MTGAVSPFACALPTAFISARPGQCFEERLLREAEHKALLTACLVDKTQSREVVTVIIKCFLRNFNSKKNCVLSRRLYCVFLRNLLLVKMGVLFIIYLKLLLKSSTVLCEVVTAGCGHVHCNPSRRLLTASLLFGIYWFYLPSVWQGLTF